ncbi:MAG: methionyl-tRNA formyltransferase [Pirellulaceae bacterium]|nr:methionyl-tRNA formyltransferase [Pirellulaceae bacterium]
MRIVLLGTGPFAVPTCQRLLAEGHDIPLVVTRPMADPKAKKQPPRPVYQWACEAGLGVFEPASINAPEAIAQLAGLHADLLFVCDYGQILSNECLRTTRLGGINLHGSLLPRHRGAAPVQWTLLSGDTEAGVTVIHMTPRLDAGPSLAVARTTIGPDESAEQLELRLSELGVAATLEAVELLSNWDGNSPIGATQDRSLVTKAPRFAKSDGQLDFRRPAKMLARQVRACQPWPSTFAELAWRDGKQMRLLIKSARATSGTIPALQNVPVGTAVVVTAESLDPEELRGNDWTAPWKRMLGVATGDGTLLIARVGPAGRRDMSVDDFLRGHPIEGNAQFQLPTTNP